jgi:hypothetical protein
MACNAAVYDKLSGSSSAIAGSPFVWAQYNTGQGGALPNASKASTIGHYLTGNGSFTVPGCESALGQIGDVDASVLPNTTVPNSNPSGSDAFDFMAQGRGISFGSNNMMWFANNNFTDANSTVQNSISSYVPTYGSAFTPAGFQTASPAFTSYVGGGLGSTFGVQSLAVDGANSPWAFGLATATGATQTQIVHLSATGTPLSTATGFLGSTYYNPATSTALHRGSGLTSYGGAIDGSGNVWAPDSDSTSTSIYVLVGAATPVVAPLSLGVRNGTLGMMP